MVYRALIAVILSLIPTINVGSEGREPAEDVQTTTITETPVSQKKAVKKQEAVDVHTAIFKAQVRTKRAGSEKFWDAVAWCETHGDWDDKGHYSGGLGIAQTTWENYGGREFAKSPSKATKVQQMIVANRISFLGFQTRHTYATLQDRQNNKPYFRPAARTRNWGKNCVNWRTRRPYKDYYNPTP